MNQAKNSLYKCRIPRAILVQLCLVISVVFIIWVGVTNLFDNMAARGLASGFAFLDDPAGFDIIFSLIRWDESMSNGRAFWVALLNTILVSVLSIIFSTFLGFIFGVARLSSNWLVKRIAAVWVETIRNIPLLLQLFVWYFGFIQSLGGPRQSLSLFNSFFLNVRGFYFPWPDNPLLLFSMAALIFVTFTAYILLSVRGNNSRLFHIASWVFFAVMGGCFYIYGEAATFEIPALQGFNFQGGAVMVPELLALFLGLSTYTSAFIAEVIRAGIQSVPRGQTEASLALGLSRYSTLRLILIPQAMRVIVPPLANQYLNLTKNSSLGSAIAFPELVLVFAGTVLGQTGMAVEIIAMTMIVYLLLSLLIAGLMNIYNAWTIRHGGA